MVGKKTGFYYEELSTQYWKLLDAGYTVDIASIADGKAPPDPSSLSETNKLPISVRCFIEDKSSINKIENTLMISDVNPNNYSVIFLPGGHGTTWDFSQSDD